MRIVSKEMDLQKEICEARDAITAIKLFQPKVAIILGSGLGEMADEVAHAVSISYSEIPGFPKTHAVGHAGRLILGYFGGLPVVMMQGRAHRYEGWTDHDVRFPVRVMQALGAETLIATNAAGGLNGRFRTGDLMVIDSHFDWLWKRQTPFSNLVYPEVVSQPIARSSACYDFALMEAVKQIARKNDIVLHQGCYVATLGPTYETRSEYRMFREMGGDAVGMSTVPEVLAARELGMEVLAFSVITNVASTDMPQSTTHDEVVDAGNEAGPNLMKIIRRLLDDLSGEPD